MISEEKTEMGRVANAGLAFVFLGGLAGLGTFLAGRFAFNLPDWAAILSGWAVGLALGLGLARVQGIRKLVLHIVGMLSELRHLR